MKLAGDDLALDTMNMVQDLQMKREVEERTLHRMAKDHNLSEMWQGSQNLLATKKEYLAQNTKMTSVGYISDTEEIVTSFWPNFQHDGAAAFILSERSPLPPALAAYDLPGEQTEIFDVRRINRIHRHRAYSDEDSAPENISDTENWLDWNGDLNNPHDSEHTGRQTMNPTER